MVAAPCAVESEAIPKSRAVAAPQECVVWPSGGVRRVGMTEELFERALGLEKPWRLERTSFQEAERRLDLYIDFERGGTFACPECGRGDCKAYDTTERSWRHLDFFQHQAFIHARDASGGVPGVWSEGGRGAVGTPG